MKKELLQGKKVPFSTIVHTKLDEAIDKHLKKTGKSLTQFTNEALAEKLEREG